MSSGLEMLEGKYPTHVVQQASMWYARLAAQGVSEADWERFWQWRDADSGHAAVFDLISKQQFELESIGESAELLELRRQALSVKPERSRPRWAMAAALAVLLAVSAFFVSQQSFRPAAGSTVAAVLSPFRSQYQTRLGEQAHFALPDGSVLELNTDTVVDVHFADGIRNLHLVRGEALFRVAHDKAHPFIVQVADDRVTALGTVFAVRSKAEGSIVSLLGGRVRVDHLIGRGSNQSTYLSPGEELVANGGKYKIHKIDVVRTASWRQKRLIFSDEPMTQVVEEVNRYSHQKLVIGDESLGDIKVSGTFRIQSAPKFAQALKESFGIEVVRDQKSQNLVLVPASGARAALPPSQETRAPQTNN